MKKEGWERAKKRGKKSYVLRVWLLLGGGFSVFLIIMELLRLNKHSSPFLNKRTLLYLVVTTLLFNAVAIVVGFSSWKSHQRYYDEHVPDIPCPNCQNKCPSDALVCQACNTDLPLDVDTSWMAMVTNSFMFIMGVLAICWGIVKMQGHPGRVWMIGTGIFISIVGGIIFFGTILWRVKYKSN